nr:hypothetical protein [Morchella crassipes]
MNPPPGSLPSPPMQWWGEARGVGGSRGGFKGSWVTRRATQEQPILSFPTRPPPNQSNYGSNWTVGMGGCSRMVRPNPPPRTPPPNPPPHPPPRPLRIPPPHHCVGGKRWEGSWPPEYPPPPSEMGGEEGPHGGGGGLLSLRSKDWTIPPPLPPPTSLIDEVDEDRGLLSLRSKDCRVASSSVEDRWDMQSPPPSPLSRTPPPCKTITRVVVVTSNTPFSNKWKRGWICCFILILPDIQAKHVFLK